MEAEVVNHMPDLISMLNVHSTIKLNDTAEHIIPSKTNKQLNIHKNKTKQNNTTLTKT
jgi:hypothetical protein